jgi:hypothetical protein
MNAEAERSGVIDGSWRRIIIPSRPHADPDRRTPAGHSKPLFARNCAAANHARPHGARRSVMRCLLRERGIDLFAADNPSAFLDNGPTSKLIARPIPERPTTLRACDARLRVAITLRNPAAL